MPNNQKNNSKIYQNELCSVSLASRQWFGLPINCHIAMDSEGMYRIAAAELAFTYSCRITQTENPQSLHLLTSYN